MQKKTILYVALLFIAVVSGFLIGNILSNNASRNNGVSENSQNKIPFLLSVINSQYVDSVDVKKINEELASDLLAKLDPHSVYIPASELEDANNQLKGSFDGIGVQFNIQNDTIMVVSVIRGGPSENVGLLAGDRIISVNDSTYVGKKVTNERTLKKLRGKGGTKVKIGVRRNGTKEILHYTIVRGQIPVNTVDIAYMITPQIGFIKVNEFGEKTYKEFLDAIAKLQNSGAKKYIIDLRENPGGLMGTAVNMVNEFLPEGRLIVYAKGKSYPRNEYKSNGKGSCQKQSIVVLMDEFSASASEIFSGAIQDNDRGTIIGRRSFGKGLVQQQLDLNDGSAVRLTIARYYTPSGRCIQKPYTIGKTDDYEMDIVNRFRRGEFYRKDRIKIADSLKFKTLKGRVVYGGGGIMPDIFVPRDTSGYTPYLNKSINYSYLIQYAFKFTDQNRERLKKIRSWQEMEVYLSKIPLLKGYIQFANSKGLSENNNQINISKHMIENLLISYISRNILNDDGFYPILYKSDKTVQKAVEVLNKGYKPEKE